MKTNDEDTVNIFEIYNTMFETLFSTAASILGHIDSIGIRFGGEDLTNPDHMLVIFNDIVIGFENWNDAVKVVWFYDKKLQNLSRNGLECEESHFFDFSQFVIRCLDAVDLKKVEFAQDIEKKDVADFIPLMR